MDWMTFIVELVKALAWPAVAVTVILTFKEKLTKLFEDITEVKGLGIEARFARGAKDALAEVAVIETVDAPVVQATEDQTVEPALSAEDLPKEQVNMLLVMVAPKAAILQARANIESAVSRMMLKDGVSDPKRARGTVAALKQLSNRGLISESILKTSLELIALGNKAAHEQFEPSVSAAKDYVMAANSVVRLLGVERKSG